MCVPECARGAGVEEGSTGCSPPVPTRVFAVVAVVAVVAALGIEPGASRC